MSAYNCCCELEATLKVTFGHLPLTPSLVPGDAVVEHNSIWLPPTAYTCVVKLIKTGFEALVICPMLPLILRVAVRGSDVE